MKDECKGKNKDHTAKLRFLNRIESVDEHMYQKLLVKAWKFLYKPNPLILSESEKRCLR